MGQHEEVAANRALGDLWSDHHDLEPDDLEMPRPEKTYHSPPRKPAENREKKETQHHDDDVVTPSEEFQPNRFDVVLVVKGITEKDAEQNLRTRKFMMKRYNVLQRLRRARLTLELITSEDGKREYYKIGATYDILQKEAEKLRMLKAVKDDDEDTDFDSEDSDDGNEQSAGLIHRKVWQPFSIAKRNQFRYIEYPDRFFQSKERQELILKLIESKESDEGAGLILSQLRKEKTILSMFALHDDQQKYHLLDTWVTGGLRSVQRHKCARCGFYWEATRIDYDKIKADSQPRYLCGRIPVGSPGFIRKNPAFMCKYLNESKNPDVQRKIEYYKYRCVSQFPDPMKYKAHMLAKRISRNSSNFMTWIKEHLRDDRDKGKVRNMWGQPLNSIRHYFGESIAFYFTWLGYYTTWLIAPAVVGLALFIEQMIADRINSVWLPFYSIFISLWATFFLEFWKRREVEVAYLWNVHAVPPETIMRAEVSGQWVRDELTGELVVEYPMWKRLFRYFLNVIVILIEILIIYWLMQGNFFLRQWIIDNFDNIILRTVPGVIYGIMILVIDKINNKIAIFLVDGETHSTLAAWETSFIWKVIILRSINSYLALFWLAFIEQDLSRVREQLASVMITSQILSNIAENVVPFIKKRIKLWCLKSKIDNPEHASIQEQAEMPPYNDERQTIDDFQEMVNQFGYVTLFAATFPLAATLAFLNNLFEMQTDAWKLVTNIQRPLARPASGIGLWYRILSLFSYLAVFTNIFLDFLVGKQLQGLFGIDDEIQAMGLAISIVVVVIVLKSAFSFVVPDEPRWVRKRRRAETYRREQMVKQLEDKELGRAMRKV